MNTHRARSIPQYLLPVVGFLVATIISTASMLKHNKVNGYSDLIIGDSLGDVRCHPVGVGLFGDREKWPWLEDHCF